MFDLKESDLPELERLLGWCADGWIARDEDGWVFWYSKKPFKKEHTWFCNGVFQMDAVSDMFDCDFDFIHWSDPEPMNIDAALAQIAEMKAAQKPSGCDFCNGKSEEHGFFIDENVLYYRNGRLGTEGIVISTCPMCARFLSPAEDGK